MGWFTQDDNENAKVKVGIDGDRKNADNPEESRTDFLIIDKQTGDHNHISVDQDGNTTEWHEYNKK
ncbi:MAG: hypothetical protein WAW91_02220 [Candidatus Nanoperiomorbaceae bacterium]